VPGLSFQQRTGPVERNVGAVSHFSTSVISSEALRSGVGSNNPVERYRDLSEPTVIQSLEHTREGLLNLVTSLSEHAPQNKEIVDRPRIGVVSHLGECGIP
jgi:hypothetical protein